MGSYPAVAVRVAALPLVIQPHYARSKASARRPYPSFPFEGQGSTSSSRVSGWRALTAHPIVFVRAPMLVLVLPLPAPAYPPRPPSLQTRRRDDTDDRTTVRRQHLRRVIVDAALALALRGVTEATVRRT